MPRNQHRAFETGLEGRTRDNIKFTSYRNTGVYNLTQSRELLKVETQLIPMKPNSPNAKRKKNFPRDMMPRGGIRITVNFYPIHKGKEKEEMFSLGIPSLLQKEIKAWQSRRRWEMDSWLTPHLGQRGKRSIQQLARTSLTITLLWAQSQRKNLILGHMVTFQIHFSKGRASSDIERWSSEAKK